MVLPFTPAMHTIRAFLPSYLWNDTERHTTLMRRFLVQNVTRPSATSRHEKTCAGTEHVCHKCNKRLSSAYGLRRHMQWHDKAPLKRKRDAPLPPAKRSRKTKQAPVSDGGSCRYRCRRCTETFDDRHALYLHGMSTRYQVGGALQNRPWGDQDAPWQLENGDVDHGLREVYNSNAPFILEPHNTGPIRSVYN